MTMDPYYLLLDTQTSSFSNEVEEQPASAVWIEAMAEYFSLQSVDHLNYEDPWS